MSRPVSSEETTASCNTKVQYKTKAWMYHFYLISTTRKLIFSEGRRGGEGEQEATPLDLEQQNHQSTNANKWTKKWNGEKVRCERSL